MYWESKLGATPAGPGQPVELQLPELPAAIKWVFLLDDEKEAGVWQELKSGETVRFVGRLSDRSARSTIQMYVRFPTLPESRQKAAEPEPEPTDGQRGEFGYGEYGYGEFEGREFAEEGYQSFERRELEDK